jgi:heme/copper-type cytochrome/quinol oxidase subunit 2
MKNKNRKRAILSLTCIVNLALVATVPAANAAGTAKAPDKLNIQVIGDGTKWNFVYTNYGIQSNQLILPLNKQVDFNISLSGASDSLWIPKLGLKIDANPYQVVNASFTAKNLSNFKIVSFAICNVHGKHMVLGQGNVLTGANFENWANKQGAHAA